jgi:hypothetical protein
MNNSGTLSLGDSTPIVMLIVEQLRQVIRQEFQNAMTRYVPAGSEYKCTTESDLGSPQYLTLKEAAKVARLAESTLRLCVSRDLLSPLRMGRKLIITRGELDRFLNSKPRTTDGPRIAAAEVSIDRKTKEGFINA